MQKILSGKNAWKTLKRIKGWSIQKSADPRPGSGHETPQQMMSQPESNLEQDFTTPGIEGDLGCPFATINNHEPNREIPGRSKASTIQRSGGLPTPPNRRGSHAVLDPIEAEFHADDFSSPPPSVTGSASKCPIRFLDQHSPEEVAKYFENHKHEIPRSHEVCVRRYQSNAENIRKLDAKYGNLVSMIQGLGHKHQPLLPASEEQEMLDAEQKSADKVGKWAEAISERLDDQPEKVEEEQQEYREGHFDRPLKEIRVGESPSRPWGIYVPVGRDPAISTLPSLGPANGGEQVLSEFTREHGPETDTKSHAGKCPFGFDRGSSPNPKKKHSVSVVQESALPNSEEKPRPDSKPVPPQQSPQMVFTGPVFIGYPADQAIALLQQCGDGSKPSQS